MSKVTPIENITSSLSQKQLEQITVHVLQDKLKESGDSSVRMVGIEGGRPLTVHLGPLSKHEHTQSLPVKEVIAMQLESAMTGAQMNKVLKNLRLKYGQSVVVPHVRDHLRDRRQIFAEYFKVEKVGFTDKIGYLIEESLFFFMILKVLLNC